MANLAAYQARITNSLDDDSAKYTTTIMDEALRKVLNEYTRASPNIKTHEHTVATAGRNQTLAAANLMIIIQLIHPYDDTLADPFAYWREDFSITFVDGSPVLYFTGNDIPQVNEIIYVKYGCKHTIDDLDSATATTVRDDHEDIIVVGASGQAAMMRASGLNEQWGGRPGDMSALMQWGTNQYARFETFLAEIKQESTMPIFPKTHWKLDSQDKDF